MNSDSDMGSGMSGYFSVCFHCIVNNLLIGYFVQYMLLCYIIRRLINVQSTVFSIMF